MLLVYGLAIALLVVFGGVVLVGAPYVPSHKKGVQEAFAKLRPVDGSDTVVDIGSGDGVVCLAACQRGAKAVGYEINPLLVLLSRLRLVRYWRRRQAQVLCRNFWQVDFPPTTSVVYTFGTSRHIAKLHAKVQQQAARLSRPIDFISYGFQVPGHQALAQEGAHFLYRVEP